MIFIIALSILVTDQLTKLLATKNLLLNQSAPLIKGIFHLTLIHNRGAAFGILKNQTPLFIFISIFAVILIYSALRNNKYKKYSFYGIGKYKALSQPLQIAESHRRRRFSCNISLALILAGALGNLIDRLRLGYVIDFLDFRIWPVFNVADSAITIGAILLGYAILKSPETRV
jgi:signal peptidase II